MERLHGIKLNSKISSCDMSSNLMTIELQLVKATKSFFTVFFGQGPHHISKVKWAVSVIVTHIPVTAAVISSQLSHDVDMQHEQMRVIHR